MVENGSRSEGSQSLPWRRRLVILLLVVAVGSIIVRMQRAPAEPEKDSSTPPGMATQLVPNDPGTEPPPEAAPEQSPLLGYVTEGAIAMLIGIAMGLATRAAAKTLAIAVVLLFVGAQVMAYQGYAAPDVGAVGRWLRDFVLNVSQNQELKSVVQDKLPAAGAFLVGYFLGLKRG